MNKKDKRIKKHIKIKMNLKGRKGCPRLFIFRSNNHIYANIIDDDSNKILVSASDQEVKGKKNKSDKAKETGKLIAKKAIEKKIEKIVFDRSGFLFHGRIKALAEGAKEGGLKF